MTDTVPATLAADPTSGRPPACDIAVVGGGAAGLHVALEAADAGGRVTVVSRTPLLSCAVTPRAGWVTSASSTVRSSTSTWMVAKERGS